MHPRALLLPALLTSLLLAGCSDDAPVDTAAPSPAATTPSTAATSGTPSATPTPTTPAAAETGAPAGGEPEFRRDRGPDTSPAERADPALTVVDVRVGEHEGYDRVVFELAGEGVVGWRVEYEDAPATQGQGDPVELAGDATLTVTLDGLGYPFETGGTEYAGPKRFAPGLPSVLEVQVGGVFEGYYDAYVGVAEQRPFRVFRLESPQRVVVDVAHGD